VLASQVSATVCGVVETPVPDTLIVAGEFVALLAILTLPLTVPAPVGANSAVTVTDWFGVSTSLVFTPLELNPAPVTPTFEIVTLEFPLFVNATLCELLLPTFTLPKLNVDVLSPSKCVAATPVPVMVIASGELGALLNNVTVPFTFPAPFGAKTALNVAVFPAPIVSGAVIPLVLNPFPLTVTDEIATDALPLFVRLIVCELFVPVTTLPNAALVGVAPSCG
jgi:hypothetical protein